jgi:hypothetical protein
VYTSIFSTTIPTFHTIAFEYVNTTQHFSEGLSTQKNPRTPSDFFKKIPKKSQKSQKSKNQKNPKNPKNPKIPRILV